MEGPNGCAHASSQCWVTLCDARGAVAAASQLAGGEWMGAACWQSRSTLHSRVHGRVQLQTMWSAERRQRLAWYMWLVERFQYQNLRRSTQSSRLVDDGVDQRCENWASDEFEWVHATLGV